MTVPCACRKQAFVLKQEIIFIFVSGIDRFAYILITLAPRKASLRNITEKQATLLASRRERNYELFGHNSTIRRIS